MNLKFTLWLCKCLKTFEWKRHTSARSQRFHSVCACGRWGTYLKNRCQIVDVGLIGYASTEAWRRHKGFRGLRGTCSPGTILTFKVLKLLEMHWNCQSYHCHVILYLLNILRSNRLDLFGSSNTWIWSFNCFALADFICTTMLTIWK